MHYDLAEINCVKILLSRCCQLHLCIKVQLRPLYFKTAYLAYWPGAYFISWSMPVCYDTQPTTVLERVRSNKLPAIVSASGEWYCKERSHKITLSIWICTWTINEPEKQIRISANTIKLPLLEMAIATIYSYTIFLETRSTLTLSSLEGIWVQD